MVYEENVFQPCDGSPRLFTIYLGHARLADIDAELKQLSVDPRRSPQRVGDADLADKLAYLCR